MHHVHNGQKRALDPLEFQFSLHKNIILNLEKRIQKVFFSLPKIIRCFYFLLLLYHYLFAFIYSY